MKRLVNFIFISSFCILVLSLIAQQFTKTYVEKSSEKLLSSEKVLNVSIIEIGEKPKSITITPETYIEILEMRLQYIRIVLFIVSALSLTILILSYILRIDLEDSEKNFFVE